MRKSTRHGEWGGILYPDAPWCWNITYIYTNNGPNVGKDSFHTWSIWDRYMSKRGSDVLAQSQCEQNSRTPFILNEIAWCAPENGPTSVLFQIAKRIPTATRLCLSWSNPHFATMCCHILLLKGTFVLIKNHLSGWLYLLDSS